MDIIRDVVKNVAVIVLLAAFIEMLAPDKAMGRYVRLVMGLFIIITLVNPIIQLFSKDLTFEVSAWNSPASSLGSRGPDLDTIIAQGRKLSQQNQEAALQAYKIRVERQIETLTQLVPGVLKVEAKVQIEDNGSKRGLGHLKQVAVVVTAQSRQGENQPSGSAQPGKWREQAQVDPVKPVQIDVDTLLRAEKSPGLAMDPGTVRQVQNDVITTINNFYGLGPEQVQVVVLAQ